MPSSRFSIIPVSVLAAQGGPPVKSVNPDRPGNPIQPNRSNAPLRDPVACHTGRANRIIKTQFIELVAGKRVKIASQHAMHAHACKTVGVGIRVDRSKRYRLDAAVAGIAQVRKPAPLPRDRTVYLKTRNIALRPRKKTASRRSHAHVA